MSTLHDIDAYKTKIALRYSGRGIILDTDVLLMFLVGTFDSEYMKEWKKTNYYTVEDFEIMKEFLRLFKIMYVTPHILTEISSHTKQMRSDIYEKFLVCFFAHFSKTVEKNVAKECIFDNSLFPILHVTDTSILDVARREKCLVITDDFSLYNNLLNEGVDVINFNHLRSMEWF